MTAATGRPRGRPSGAKNKRTIAEARKLAASGEMPLDYMLRVLRDPTVDHDRRDRMAKDAAPYVHSRLATTELTGKDGGPVVVEVVRFAGTPS